MHSGIFNVQNGIVRAETQPAISISEALKQRAKPLPLRLIRATARVLKYRRLKSIRGCMEVCPCGGSREACQNPPPHVDDGEGHIAWQNMKTNKAAELARQR